MELYMQIAFGIVVAFVMILDISLVGYCLARLFFKVGTRIVEWFNSRRKDSDYSEILMLKCKAAHPANGSREERL